MMSLESWSWVTRVQSFRILNIIIFKISSLRNKDIAIDDRYEIILYNCFMNYGLRLKSYTVDGEMNILQTDTHERT